MKSAILIQLIALPSIFASLQLAIVAQKKTYIVQALQVTGKGDHDGEILVMNSTAPFIDQSAKCLTDDKTWTRWGCGGQNRTEYKQIAQFNFSEATKDPRPFVFHFPDINSQDDYYTFSGNPNGYWKACNITVKGDGKDYVWDILGGFLDQETDDAIDIHCGNNMTYKEATALFESGTDSNKDIWSLAKEAWGRITASLGSTIDDTASYTETYNEIQASHFSELVEAASTRT